LATSDERHIVLKVRNGRPYFAAVPRTAKHPTVAQMLQRLRLAEVASRARGLKMTGELPPAAEAAEALRGRPTGMAQRKLRIWEQELLEQVREQFPEPAEQQRMIKVVMEAFQ
jgi:hypothetical protein